MSYEFGVLTPEQSTNLFQRGLLTDSELLLEAARCYLWRNNSLVRSRYAFELGLTRDEPTVYAPAGEFRAHTDYLTLSLGNAVQWVPGDSEWNDCCVRYSGRFNIKREDLPRWFCFWRHVMSYAHVAMVYRVRPVRLRRQVNALRVLDQIEGKIGAL